MKLKQISIKDKSFTANGKTYLIETGDISIERWAKYEELSLEMQYGTDQVAMFQNWKKVTELANELKFSDIAILAHNMQNGMLQVMSREPVALKLCALFINEENENRAIITDDMISQKINDWRVEGYSIGPFFQLALVFSKLTQEIFNLITEESLQKLEELNQEKIQG